MGVGCATWWYKPPRQEDGFSAYRVSRIVHGVAVPCYTRKANCVILITWPSLNKMAGEYSTINPNPSPNPNPYTDRLEKLSEFDEKGVGMHGQSIRRSWAKP